MPENKEEVKSVYDGITIIYDESGDVWRFELRGRNRKADSLKQAKEFIDKPVPEEVKKKTFEPTPAYYKGYRYHDDAEFEEVMVTSIAEDSRFNSIEAWIKDSSGSRSKVGVHTLYVKNDTNFKVIEQMKALDKQIKALNGQKEKAFATMQKFEVQREEVKA